MTRFDAYSSIYFMITMVVHLINFIAKRGLLSDKYSLRDVLNEFLGAFAWPYTLYLLLKKYPLWPEE